MKNLTKISIITLLTLFISNCGDKVREEITERYDDGKLKVVEYYKKVGDNQELVRKREYHKNGQIRDEGNYKDGQQDGKWVYYDKKENIIDEDIWENGKCIEMCEENDEDIWRGWN